jgi:hypothetical protein
VNEIIDEMIDCVPHLIFMKALVEKLNSEKPPQLQIMIKKISFILRKARKEEIRPFLDHIIDSFKIVKHKYFNNYCVLLMRFSCFLLLSSPSTTKALMLEKV